MVWDVLIDDGTRERQKTKWLKAQRNQKCQRSICKPWLHSSSENLLISVPHLCQNLALIFDISKTEVARLHDHSNSHFGNIPSTALQLFPLLLCFELLTLRLILLIPFAFCLSSTICAPIACLICSNFFCPLILIHAKERDPQPLQCAWQTSSSSNRALQWHLTYYLFNCR